MNSIFLTVSTPDGNVFSGDIYKLSVRGAEGDLAVMPGHIPFVTSVRSGEISIENCGGELKKALVGGGILTVGADKVNLLVSSYKES